MPGMVVEIEAEDGTCGVGVSIGGEPGCYIAEHHLARFCEGQDPRNIELMWEPWRFDQVPVSHQVVFVEWTEMAKYKCIVLIYCIPCYIHVKMYYWLILLCLHDFSGRNLETRLWAHKTILSNPIAWLTMAYKVHYFITVPRLQSRSLHLSGCHMIITTCHGA